MDTQSVYNWLHKEPFVPFRISMSNGRVFEVVAPELALLSRTDLLFGQPDPDFPVPIMKNATWIALSHINSIEPISVSSTPTVS